MKNVSQFVLLAMFLACLGMPLQGQVLINEDFWTNPFGGLGPQTNYAENTTANGCPDPCYSVSPNFNIPCSAMPNISGSGNFLMIDNDNNSNGMIYGEVFTTITAGQYSVNLDGINRYNGPGSGRGAVNLDIRLGGVTQGTITVNLQNQTWESYNLDFTLNSNPGTALFEIVQTNTGLDLDYAIDNLRFEKLADPCEIMDPEISYCVTGDEYCFEVEVGNNPDISMYEYTWDFGDGATATGSSACHTFASGQYNVCVFIEAFGNGNSFGGQAIPPCDTMTICREICVIAEEEPCACGITNLNMNIWQSGCQVFLTPSVQVNECTTIDSYTIDWGDGQIQSGSGMPSFLSHSYSTGPIYIPMLTVSGSNGNGQQCQLVDTDAIGCGFVGGGGGRPKMANPNENGSEIDLQVYPNPTSGTLKVQHGFDQGNLEVLIRTAEGRIVSRYEVAAEGALFSLELGELAAGFYFIQVKGAEGRWVHKSFVME